MNSFIFLDMVSSARTILQHPINRVWPYLLDQKMWMTEFAIETVEGERNEEGEVKKVTPVSGKSPHFFFKTLLLVPFRKFVYKAYTDDRAGRFGFTGVEVLCINDVGNDSVVTFEAYLEVQSSTMTREELTDFVVRAKEGALAMWERNFQRLAVLLQNSQET